MNEKKTIKFVIENLPHTKNLPEPTVKKYVKEIYELIHPPVVEPESAEDGEDEAEEAEEESHSTKAGVDDTKDTSGFGGFANGAK
jgi:hypothetical protein